MVFAKKQSSTDMTGQLWMESLLINLEKGGLPRPASKVRWNAGLAMTESLFHPKRTTQGGEQLPSKGEFWEGTVHEYIKNTR
jgi:hypothetical protein